MPKKRQLSANGAATGIETLRVGFVPLVDCAPLVAAKEFGFFRQHGLRVQLSRELGWASVRDKMLYGELHASQAVVGMPLACCLGIGSATKACCTGMVLNRHGNGITLSNQHFIKGASAAECVQEAADRVRGERKLVFGTVSLVSSHYFLLRRWLESCGIDVEREVEIAVVPPPQMPVNLQAENLDGYCVGEPWNSIAVHAGVGFMAAVSTEIEYGHPEKVLMVRQAFAERREEEHLRLIAALMDACAFCQEESNRDKLASLLSRQEYVGASKAIILRSLNGNLSFGHGRKRELEDFHVFSAPGLHLPDAFTANWAQQGLIDAAILPAEEKLSDAELGVVYREQVACAAEAMRHSDTPMAAKN